MNALECQRHLKYTNEKHNDKFTTEDQNVSNVNDAVKSLKVALYIYVSFSNHYSKHDHVSAMHTLLIHGLLKVKIFGTKI